MWVEFKKIHLVKIRVYNKMSTIRVDDNSGEGKCSKYVKLCIDPE